MLYRYSDRFVLLAMLFLFIGLSIPSTLATEVFNDWVGYGETFTVEGYNYSVIPASDDMSAILLKSQLFGSVALNLGSFYQYNQYTFTYDEFQYPGMTDSNVSGIVHGSEEEYEFKIIVDEQKPTLDITRTPDVTELLVLGETTVTVTFANTGTGDVKGIHFKEVLPSYFSFSDTPYVRKGTTKQYLEPSGKTLSWNGNVYEDEVINITYQIKLNQLPEDECVLLPQNITYTYQDTDFILELEETSFTVEKPILVTITPESETAELGNIIRYVALIENTHALETVVVDQLHMVIPDGSSFQHGSVNDLQKGDGFYDWSGKLGPGSSKSFDFDLKLTKPGENTFTADAVYVFEDYAYNETFDGTVTIATPEITGNITSNKASYVGGSAVNITFMVQNEDDQLSFSNVETTLYSDLFSPLSYRYNLGPNDKTILKKKGFLAPYADKEITYTFSMNGTATYGSQIFSFTDDLTVSVSASTFAKLLETSLRTSRADSSQATLEATITALENVTYENVTYQNSTFENVTLRIISDDFKKTLSLTQDELATLNSDRTIQRTFTYPLLTSENSTVVFTLVTMYDVGNDTYQYDTLSTLTFASQGDSSDDVDALIKSAEGNGSSYQENTSSTVFQALGNLTSSKNPSVKNSSGSSLVITSQKSQTKQVLLKIGLFVVLFVIVGLCIQYYLNRKKKMRFISQTLADMHSEDTPEEKRGLFDSVSVPDPSYDHGKLQAYLDFCKQKKMTKDKVKKKLTDAGWLEEIVDVYLKNY